MAEAFNQIADLLEFRGENPFRIHAYRRGAEAVLRAPEEPADMARAHRLGELPGIGTDLAGKIEEILLTGTCGELEKLRREAPAGLEELLELPGVGPRTAARLYRERGIGNRVDLARALAEGKLRDLSGIGKRREAQLAAVLRQGERLGVRHPLSVTLPLSTGLAAEVGRFPGVFRAEVAGSIRRFRDTTGDIDLVAATEDPAAVCSAFTRLPGVERVLAEGETRARVILAEGIQADLLSVKPAGFAAVLHHSTGSKGHNVRLRALARSRGLTLNEYGLFRGDMPIAVTVEDDIYRHLGLPYVPPELREDAGEVEAALAGKVPVLLKPWDILGDLHVHTDWSDGRHSLGEMAAAARRRGYRYLAVCDHSRSLGITRGLDEERLKRQRVEIAAVNAAYRDFRLLAGVEVDIRPDGTLSLSDEVLAQLDWVTASVHTGLGAGREAQTRRLVRAMENPHVDVIGHPTGRILGKREAYPVDMEEVMAVAARTGTALELNASLKRLDLDTEHLRLARERGVKVAVNSDAHSTESIGNMDHGVRAARRGWLGTDMVLNARARPWA